MNKHLYVLLIFSLFLSFFGCSENITTTEEQTLSRLDTPTSIVIDGAMVSWDKVDGASSYEIFLNEDSFYINSNYYLIKQEGNFDIKVIAKGNGFLNSVPTEILTTTISFAENVTYNINIINDYIFWKKKIMQ